MSTLQRAGLEIPRRTEVEPSSLRRSQEHPSSKCLLDFEAHITHRHSATSNNLRNHHEKSNSREDTHGFSCKLFCSLILRGSAPARPRYDLYLHVGKLLGSSARVPVRASRVPQYHHACISDDLRVIQPLPTWCFITRITAHLFPLLSSLTKFQISTL